MSEALAELAFLKQIGFVITYKCEVSCPHCIINAGPTRKEQIALSDAMDWIRQVAAYRDGFIRMLALTGGEPFYDLDLLQEISQYARDCGLLVSAVTNGYWAETPQRALEVLRQLPAISVLAVSTDVYHQQAIPIERVKNAVLAAQECERACQVSLCTESEKDPEYQSILEQVHTFADKEQIEVALTFPVGRAAQTVLRSKYERSIRPPQAACVSGGSPIVFPDGRIVACIGPIIGLPKTRAYPLALGTLRALTLAEILDEAETNAVLHAVRVWGPRKLIALLQAAGYGDLLPSEYIQNSVCNTCYALMSNPKIAASLATLQSDFEFMRQVAYGRVYYLRENRMVELLQERGVLQA